MNKSGDRIIRVLTVALGGIPAVAWLPLLAIWMLFAVGGFVQSLGGPIEQAPLNIAIVTVGLLGAWGAFAIWEAALGPLPIEKPTARGLAAGIVAMVIFIAAISIMFGDADSRPGRPGLLVTWLAIGPIAVAAWHLYAFSKNKQD